MKSRLTAVWCGRAGSAAPRRFWPAGATNPFIALCVAALFSANAGAENSEILWVLPVTRLCIAQDPAYEQTFLGRWIMSGQLGFRSSEFDACARQKTWIPRAMCDEVMSLQSEDSFSEGNLGRLRRSYASTFQRLSAAGEYIEAFERANAKGVGAPSCPQEAAASAPSQRFDIFAGANDAGLRGMAEPVRNVSVWRLTPGVLLERCAIEAPEREASMRAAHGSWSQANAPLISLIDRVVGRVVPLYASSLAVSDSEAKNRMAAVATAMIADRYLKNDKGGGSRGCADYEKTVAGLSGAQADVTRGFVYAVEAMLAARKSGPSAQSPSAGKAPN